MTIDIDTKEFRASARFWRLLSTRLAEMPTMDGGGAAIHILLQRNIRACVLQALDDMGVFGDSEWVRALTKWFKENDRALVNLIILIYLDLPAALAHHEGAASFDDNNDL